MAYPSIGLHHYFDKGAIVKKFCDDEVAKILQVKDIPASEKQFVIFLGEYYLMLSGEKHTSDVFWGLASKVFNYEFSLLKKVWG